ncbi:prolipoprotein diacylglyceryl transferase [Aldersonia kunmingensis]|uniref:prolipoprotein diacylglyceryl transferase n=1 Tax=Aldersonia kunmingensis TaxID=408066 RepID=UPI000A8B0014|nr:prolipoprotein diacylglyceryl transferase [Aldersonia kunmingensis]
MTSDGVNPTGQLLAYIPSPPQGVWEIGPFPLRAYALFIIIGIIVAIYWGEKRWMARGGAAGTVLDVAVWAVPFGLIGGRLYHVITDASTYFGEGGHPADAFKIWEGGLGIWGAVLLGGVGAWIGCRRRGIPLPAFGDALAPAILLAQAIGRLGNYFNQELYGRQTDLPWGLKIYERVDSSGAVDQLGGVSTGVVEKIVHPTFLYEIVWNLLVVVALVLIDKRFQIGHGRIFALYVAGYSLGRFFIELMRDDYATHIGGIRINLFTAAIVFAAAVAYFFFATKGREEPWTLQPADDRHPPGSQVEYDDLDERDAAKAADEEAETGTDEVDETDTDATDDKSADDSEEDASADGEDTETEGTEPEKSDTDASESTSNNAGGRA